MKSTYADPFVWAEFRIILFNGGTSSSSWDINIEFEAISTVWDIENNITKNYQWGEYECSIDEKIAGFDWCTPSSQTYSVGKGLYKVTAKKNNTTLASFDFDWRTSDWSDSPDLDLYYNIGSNIFMDVDKTININWTHQKVWDLTNIIHVTTDLEPPAPQYFTISSYNNRPELNWEMPDYVQTYKIYRSIDFPHF